MAPYIRPKAGSSNDRAQQRRVAVYTDQSLPVRAVLTNNGRECCGTTTTLMRLLGLNDIEHRRIRVRTWLRLTLLRHRVGGVL